MSGIPAGAGSLLGKRLGKYEILALLALGGTAEIYLARIGGTNGFEKYVVVKCLHDHLADDQDFVKMFLDEARMAAVLDHSNIVQTFELGEHENRYYMVMEFLAGLSLAMVVRRAGERLPGGKIGVPLILNIAAQACAGLHYAHERQANGKPLNMVHRDISPQNLVISFEGVVKVVDFGIARAESRETKTKAGTIKGKFAYMSPEQCVATNVDRRTDIFALGVIVHELLTGRRLFKRNSPYETYQAVIECAVDAPSAVNHELDPHLDDVIMKAVAKDKTDRYPTAEAFGDALLGYLHHRGKASGPGEIAKFFDQYFAQEIDEHGERMRELISGRDFSVDTGVSWGTEEEEAAKRAQETLDLGSAKKARDAASLDLGSGDIEMVRASEASLEEVVGRLQTQSDDGADDDEIPADKTRIETNPLDKLKEMEAAHTPVPVPMGSVTGGPARLPAPPTGPVPAAIGAKASGRFPDLANLPTMIAPDESGQAMAQTSTALPPSSPMLDPAAQEAVRQSQQRAMQPMGGSPYPVIQGGRPFNSDLAPSVPPSPQLRPSMPAHSFDAQHAANVMSPVGDQYPHAVDWDAAAAQSAKALPPWMLGALFVGALFVALLVTIVIAKIVH